MATSVNFSRILCPAAPSIGFHSQIDVYFREPEMTDDSRLDVRRVSSANIGLVEEKLVADFHLTGNFFVDEEEIVVESIIAGGWPTAMTTNDAIRITGIIITRRPGR